MLTFGAWWPRSTRQKAFGPSACGGHQARPPIRDHGRIEGRLVELVLEEHPPVAGQARIDLGKRLEIPVEHAIEVRLAGEVGAVGDPHRQRLRAELLADLDAFEIMRDRLVPHGLRRVGQRAELVGELLPGLVLKGVGIDRVEADAERLGEFGERAIIADLVPREMRRAGRRGARELLDRRAVLELVEHVARLAGAGKAGEARAAGADAPGRHGDAEGGDLGGDRLDVEPAPRELSSERAVVVFEFGGAFRVRLGDQRVGNAVRHLCSSPLGRPYRAKLAALPASTLRMLPVLLADKSEAK